MSLLKARASTLRIGQVLKSGFRAMGIAESTPPDAEHTVLAGVVMRADLFVDGIVWGQASLGGMDATDAVVKLVRRASREDLGSLMLHGAVIAGYNVINLPYLHRSSGLPVISVTREPRAVLLKKLKAKFPDDWMERWDIVQRNGEMHPLSLPTGITVYIQFQGVSRASAGLLVKRFTKFGGVPEPIRVARLFARAIAQPSGRDEEEN